MGFSAYETPSWERDGVDWPNRAASRFVDAGGLSWHVQRMGHDPDGGKPILLLIHGTGAATHSWRDVMPVLSRRFDVIAPDLPGHGFTAMPRYGGLSLPMMSRCLAALLDTLRVAPDVVCGHSAGAAILMWMCLKKDIAPNVLIGLNAALLPFDGMAGTWFSPIAKALAGMSLTPRFFSWNADRRSVDRLLRKTGSTIDETGTDWYLRLMRRPSHVAAALNMMAHWDLKALERRFAEFDTRLFLVAGSDDRAVPVDQAGKVAALVPDAEVRILPGLGHLAHEEDPEGTAALICDVAAQSGIMEANAA